MQFIEKAYSLSDCSALRVGGDISAIIDIFTIDDLHNARERYSGDVLIPFGGGTNMLGGSGESLVLLKNNLFGKQVVELNEEYVIVECASGEVWDDVVAWAVNQGFQGIEALSAIPGSAGGAVVQNAGAYGSELKDVVTSIAAVELSSGEVTTFSHEECEFRYRSSAFKTFPSRWFVTSFRMKLSRLDPPIPNYAVVEEYFSRQGNNSPSLQDIRTVITDIRWSKLPRPEDVPNCGSWFKNPIIPTDQAHDLLVSFPQMVQWDLSNGMTKCSAGWLLDTLFGKGYEYNGFKLFDKNALIITNPQRISSTTAFLEFEQHLISKVLETFGIPLEREPVFVNRIENLE